MVVADAVNRFTHNLRNFHVSFGGDFASHDNEAGGNHGLACNAGIWILLEHGIQNGV